MITFVPPPAGPARGATCVTTGATRYVNWAAVVAADVPPGVVTNTWTVPVPAGTVAVICVSEFTVKAVAAAWQKVTAVAAVKPQPLIVTCVPPAATRRREQCY